MKFSYPKGKWRGGIFLSVLVSIVFLVACDRGNDVQLMLQSEDSIVETDAGIALEESATPISISIASAIPTAVPTLAEIKSIEAFCNVWSLRVRAGAGTNTSMIAGLRYEDTLTLIGRNADGSWVKFSGGWVAVEFLVVDGDIVGLPILTGESEGMVSSTAKATATLQATLTGTEVDEATSTATLAPSVTPTEIASATP